MTCDCCYCKTKNTSDNPEYIRGIKFASQWVEDEWDRLKEGVDRWRKQQKEGKITDRIYRSRVEHLENQMRFLGEWHDVLAKEGNKSLNLIKDIDHKEYLYGEY
jgi:hypothetical protein